MKIVYNKNYESLKYIFSNVLILLFIGQFDLLMTKSYAISSLTILIIAGFFITKNYYDKSIFLVIMLIYISSFFKIFPTIGNTFALMFFIIFLAIKINKKKTTEIISQDKWINALIAVLIISCAIGWGIKSQLEGKYFVTSIISFFSFILLFYTAKGIRWTSERVRIFINITAILLIYAVFTSVINPLGVMPFKSPLWNSYDISYQGLGTIFISMIERPSNAVGAMIFGMFFCWTLNTNRLSLNKNNRNTILFGLMSAFIVCIGGFSKSHTIVLLSSIGIVPILNSLAFKTNIFKGNLKIIPYFILFLTIILITNSFFNYKYLFIRFEEQSGIVNRFIENPLLPENTSREQSFSMGQESLKRENWLIGYGYANGGHNRIAWFGVNNYKEIRKKDFHNTYYSLPQVFGWFGGIAYILLFIITILRMYQIAQNRKNKNIFRVFALSLFTYFLLHLFTEYTITSLSSPHYLMMLFIMLGLANALYSNNKLCLLEKTDK